MTGSHEPPSGKSFWISLVVSTLKFGVLVAAVVVGVVVLARAFQSPQAAIGPGVSTPTQTATPGPPGKSPKAVHEKPPKSPGPSQGVRVGVYNATTTAGLAAQWQSKLENKGYVGQELGTATQTSKTTTLYYRKASDKTSADQLASTIFKGATVVALPKDLQVSVNGVTTKVDKGVQVAIFVGEDQAK